MALLLASVSGAAVAQAYVIRSVDFQVKGRTKEFVLMAIIDPNREIPGSSFPDKVSLDVFVADRTRLLSSQRVLAAVTPSYEAIAAADGGWDVALHFATTDSWNIIALPYAKYDSNSGLLLSLRGRDYDFLGSAQPLELNLNYQNSPSGVGSYGWQFDFTVPFQAVGAIWNLGFVEDGLFLTDGSSSSIASASISYNLPGLGFPVSVMASQSYSYNANPLDPHDADSWFLGESATAAARIPLTGSLGSWFGVDLGPLSYVPAVEVSYSWKPGTTLGYYGNGSPPSAMDTTAAQALQNFPEYYGRGGILATLSNGLAFGRIDWAGNMREGIKLSITSREAYNAQWNDLIGDIIVESELFAQWNRKVGVGARLYGIGRLSGNFPADYLTMLGQYMRGIMDIRMQGVQAVVLNGNVPVKLFDFPTHVFIKTRALDFELQAQPFLDAGLARPNTASGFSSDWLWYAGGLELLFYPEALRSFTVRLSGGWDLKNVISTRSLTSKTPDGFSPYEIYLGLNLLF